MACAHDVGGAEFGDDVRAESFDGVVDGFFAVVAGDVSEVAVQFLVVIGQSDALEVYVEDVECALADVYAVSGDVAVAVLSPVILQRQCFCRVFAQQQLVVVIEDDVRIASGDAVDLCASDVYAVFGAEVVGFLDADDVGVGGEDVR